jgi:hypothetical protein
MKKRVPIAIAAVLTACGAVATNSNEAESAPQKSAKAKQPPSAGFPHYEQGGMAGCFDPKLSGYARAAAERIGGVPCKQTTSATPAAARAGSDLFAGRWSADFDGGGGNVTIIPRGPTQSSYWIEMDVANSEGCAGELSGEGTARNNRLTLRLPIPNDTNQCVVDFTRQGRNLSIRADNCHYFSGMSCGFTGTARFVHATETLEPPMD